MYIIINNGMVFINDNDVSHLSRFYILRNVVCILITYLMNTRIQMNQMSIFMYIISMRDGFMSILSYKYTVVNFYDLMFWK